MSATVATSPDPAIGPRPVTNRSGAHHPLSLPYTAGHNRAPPGTATVAVRTAITGRTRMKVVVIGAGIVGTCCGWHLAREGHAVELVDPLPPGCGTSFGNAGILSYSHVLPVGHPGVLRALPRLLLRRDSPLRLRWGYLPVLAPWLLRLLRAARPGRFEAHARALHALVSRAEAAHEAVIEACGLRQLVRASGWLKVARDGDAFDRETAWERRFLERFGVPHEVVAGARLRELEPALVPEVRRGLFLPRERRVVYPLDYTRGIFADLERRGGRWRQARVASLRVEGGRVRAVVTDRGTLAPELVVLAAGVFSRELLRPLGLAIPLEAERGYHATLPAPAAGPGPERPVLALEDGFLLAPMKDGIRLTTGIELASPYAPPDFRPLRRLVARVGRWLAGIEPRILGEWIGYRPCLPDSLPVIGFAPRCENLLLAFGHHHLGLTLAAVTGRIVADLVAGRDPGLDLAPYRADRPFV